MNHSVVLADRGLGPSARRLAAWLLLGLALALWALSVHAQATTPRRLALVLGNDQYQAVSKLQKAGNDATAMAAELRAAGFEVTLARDLAYRGMVRAFETFTAGIAAGDQVVVFFAGHGVQIRTGSYLLPVDIEATTESEIEKTAYGLNDLTEKLGEAKAAFTLVIVDACRDNPLKANGRSIGASPGLAAVEPPKGQMVVYSASRGQQALDRLNDQDRDPNGVFTREFIARMRQPGRRIEEVVREVQEAVESLARTVRHDQRPAIYNESRGHFYFFPLAPGQAQSAAATSQPGPGVAAPPQVPAATGAATVAALAEAASPAVAAFRRSPLAASSSPADVAAVSRMLALPAGAQRTLGVSGHDNILAMAANDTFFKAPPGEGRFAWTYMSQQNDRLLSGVRSIKMERSCARRGPQHTMTTRTGTSATIEALGWIGGLLTLESVASQGGYTGKASTRITGIASVWGQPFPLVPGQRFGLSYTTTRDDGIGRLFGSDTTQAQWHMECGVTETRSDAVPDGARQLVCLTTSPDAPGVWSPIRRLYLHEPTGCLVDTQ